MPFVKPTKIYWFLFVVILLISSYLRLQSSINGTFAYTYDVGRDMLNIANIVDAHHISLIGPTTGQEGIFYGPWWYWLITPFFILFSGSVRGIDAFMGLTGVLTVLLVYWLGNKIGGRWVGLLSMLFAGISNSLIDTSSQIWNPNVSPLVLICILIVIVKFSEEEHKINQSRWLVLLGLLAALSFDSLEIVYGSVQLIALLVFMFVYLRKKFRPYNIFSFLTGVVIIELPRIMFEFRHQFLMTKALFYYIFHHAPVSQSGGILTQSGKVLTLMLQLWSGTVNLPFEFGVILLVIVISGLVYFKTISSFNKTENLLGVFSTCYLLSYVIILSFFKGNVWDHFVVGVPVVYVIMFSLFIYRLLLFLKTKNANYFNFILVIIVVYVLGVLSPNLHYNRVFFLNDPSVYNNQVAVINYIYAQAKGRPFSYNVYTPPIHPYTYEYLFSYYAKNNYYAPSNNGHLLFYIIEPDKTHPTLRESWLLRHDNRGKLIKSLTFPGHILVQTRII